MNTFTACESTNGGMLVVGLQVKVFISLFLRNMNSELPANPLPLYPIPFFPSIHPLIREWIHKHRLSHASHILGNSCIWCCI